MKSLGLNYSCWTLIVIDKTPVARTNGSRLAPLQAALQEEQHSDRGGGIAIWQYKDAFFLSFFSCNSPLLSSARLFECLVTNAVFFKPDSKYVTWGPPRTFRQQWAQIAAFLDESWLFASQKVHRLFKADTSGPERECLNTWRREGLGIYGAISCFCHLNLSESEET